LKKNSSDTTRRNFLKGLGGLAAGALLPRFTTANPVFAVEKSLHQPRSSDTIFRFAHVTDLHYTTRAQNRYPQASTIVGELIAELNTQDLDAILLTGDMFHYPGDVEAELDNFAHLLESSRHPIYFTHGNHDVEGHNITLRKTRLRDRLGQITPWPNDYYHVNIKPGLQLVVLDTTDVGDSGYHVWTGHFSEKQKLWLIDLFKHYPDDYFLICLHHPPITPYPFLERLRFDPLDEARLAQALSFAPNNIALFCGHYHFGGFHQYKDKYPLLIGPGFVEYPHPYRILELNDQHLNFNWQTLRNQKSIGPDEQNPLSLSRLRSQLLMQLSYQHSGQVLRVLSQKVI
jgi:hypothetical protein